jgi:GTP-binding protein LepA
MKNIRNFCIIAHIDHGKSTLADRLIERTATVSAREMKSQLLDTMDLERERGITIKLQPVRMRYVGAGGTEYQFNLIDTPGHVDFTYEVSRSLAAVEGAILLVDATQGVQAQTLGNLYLAVEQDLAIIPVVNKMDLPNADPERTRDEIVGLLGCDPGEVIFASGKTGIGVDEILAAVAERVPPPQGDPDRPLRALVFDSLYDTYKGVVAFVRVVDGSVKAKQSMELMASGAEAETLEVGCFAPKFRATPGLSTGEIGYVVTGLKDIAACRVGDTVTVPAWREAGVQPLIGYKDIMPMVYAGLFPTEGDAYNRMRDALLKLRLSDAALAFEPEHSPALGFGFRAGFLGLLHLEIVKERLRREHDMEVIVTSPSVAYRVTRTDGKEVEVRSPQALPDPNHLREIREPWVKADIVSPREYIGNIMALVADKRGVYQNTEYLRGAGEGRVILHYEMPLAGILVDFYDRLKSATSGYASLNYEVSRYEKADVVRLDVLVADEPVEALATIVYRDEAEREGRRLVEKLAAEIPRHQFEVKVQAAIGGKIVAASRVKAYRKDVTGSLYGGDWTRKMKLLEKQKKGKKRMMSTGKVEIPPDAYISVLRRGE